MYVYNIHSGLQRAVNLLDKILSLMQSEYKAKVDSVNPQKCSVIQENICKIMSKP